MEKVKITTKLSDGELLKLMKRISETVVDYLDGGERCCYLVDVEVVSDNVMRELNHTYRKLNRTTSSLAFPYMDVWHDAGVKYINLGQIVVSLPAVKRRAGYHHNTFRKEFAQTYLHALLHLFGYDHMKKTEREKMRKVEKEVLKKIWSKR